uniref:Putative secreted protein n=1 Tax=Xenopsylla cheopis TaxID=163159 RepID=A0A6M2DWV7_XENCH
MKCAYLLLEMIWSIGVSTNCIWSHAVSISTISARNTFMKKCARRRRVYDKERKKNLVMENVPNIKNGSGIYLKNRLLVSRRG